ncbi:MAG: ABC transporter substrate-binding protein [Anaerolineae bacterium]
MKARYTLIALAAIAVMLLGACAQPAPSQPAAPTKAPEPLSSRPSTPAGGPSQPATPTKAPEPKTLVTWFEYDETNMDPKSDERVGNEYLRKAIPAFNKAFEGKWVWKNQFTPWDKLEANIIAAVQAKGEVPDIVEIGTSSINTYYRNGTLQDLMDWAKAQSWWSDMDPSAIKACTGPDGKLYCIPMAERPHLVYVWKDRFPNGFPKTPEQFLAEGERLKKEGLYAMTFFGSTDFDGNGATRAVWTTIASFGGTYDDGKGKMLLNTPENVAAVAWLREMVQRGYVPEIAFAGGFQEEEAFKDASAAAFPTGLFGYRYLNPLTAPSGKKYDTKTEQDMLNAIAEGDVILQPMVAPEGKKPGCNISSPALAIPVGAKNPEAARDLINWLLKPEQNPDYVLGPGAGFPVLKSQQALPQFQTPFYQQAAEAVNASACRPWFGSLEDSSSAQKIIMNAVYKLIKQDPTADIATELQKAQDEYNKQHG